MEVDMAIDDEEVGYPDIESDLSVETARHKLDSQLSAINAIDTKIGLIFGFASATLTLPTAVLAMDDVSPPCSSVVLIAIGAAAFLACAIFSIWGFSVRNWKMGPNLSDLWKLANAENEKTVGWWTYRAYMLSYDENRDQWYVKGDCAKYATGALAIQTIFLGAGMIAALSA